MGSIILPSLLLLVLGRTHAFRADLLLLGDLSVTTAQFCTVTHGTCMVAVVTTTGSVSATPQARADRRAHPAGQTGQTTPVGH